jgi:beta-xylosidase
VIGHDRHPVLEHPAPARARHSPPSCPVQSDSFRDTDLGPQWYWQANPHPSWLTLAGDGLARLRAVPNDLGNLRTTPQILGRQLHGGPTDLTTSLLLDATDPGTRAGLVVLGEDYACIGLTRDAAATRVETRTYTPGQGETVRFSAPVPAPATPVQLRVSSTDEGLCVFRFRTTPDGEWTTALDGFQALPALWTSAELGLFATAPPGTPGTGQALFGAVGAP